MTPASPWVVRFAGLVPPGEVLDLACGGGRHARLMAARGHAVLAVDRDVDALAALDALAASGIASLQCDLERPSLRWPFDLQRFAGIIVTNYLHRPLLPALFASLAPGAVLIYETFAEGNQQFGKPSCADFLLRRGELLKAAQEFGGPEVHVLAFEDGYVAFPKPAMLQRLCAIRLRPGMPPPTLCLD